eukprot:TRINITY_DN6475_c0_g1_i1.p1 TRINITY_DN6475_c0_g1~~TRINITY_DN6475_c0_g1_i1.p1  ORF type:complete len:391 (+),score=-29.58 TRINITY_DN6475_c0_g1_i1:251-1423(+)
MDFQSIALPTELQRHFGDDFYRKAFPLSSTMAWKPLQTRFFMLPKNNKSVNIKGQNKCAVPSTLWESMVERKKVGLLPVFLVLIGLVSCVTQPDVPLITAAVVPTTTTTTVPRPAIIIIETPATTTTTTTTTTVAVVATTTTTVAPVPTTTTTTTTTTIAPLPPPSSITEPELRNLFGMANQACQEVLSYGIDSILTEQSRKAFEQFEDAKANYDAETGRLSFDGAAAYPIAAMLENSEANLSALLAEGLPLRSDAEKGSALAAADKARTSGSSLEAAGRYQDAEAEFADADNSLAEGDYRTAITSYRRASILYESAAARANAETLRSKVSETDYGKYSPYHAAEAERLWEEDAELYAVASNESIAEGSAKLIAAERDYAQILTCPCTLR